MEFWVGLYGMQSPRTHPRSLPAMYADLLEHAVLAERLGFDGFGVTEHHFWYDGYCPSLLPALAAVARRTRRIRLVPCAFLLPLHDPLRVAEQVAVLDQLSHGRVELAFGYGYRPEEYGGFGLEMKARGPRFSEAVEVLRGAWSGRSGFEGRYYRYPDGEVVPQPLQRPHPPMWLAGGSQAVTARRAGRLGLGYMAPAVSLPFDHVAALIAEYRAAAREAGVPAERVRVGAATDVAIAETRAAAQRIVDEDVMPVYAEQLAAFGFVRETDGTPVRELPPSHPVFQVLVDGIIAGTPADVIARIERFAALGIDVFVPRLVEANFQSERILAEMRLFAEQVLPHFRGGRR